MIAEQLLCKSNEIHLLVQKMVTKNQCIILWRLGKVIYFFKKLIIVLVKSVTTQVEDFINTCMFLKNEKMWGYAMHTGTSCEVHDMRSDIYIKQENTQLTVMYL